MFRHSAAAARPVPAQAGIGLRFPHHMQVIRQKPAVAWFEVNPENYMGEGWPRECLEEVRKDYPVSFHAVGLSLGSTDPLDADHLARLVKLADEIQPALMSDHLSWSTVDGTYLADLLPLPYTEEALAVVSRHVDAAQNALGRRLLIENPSRYLDFDHATMSEAAFLAELARSTGCGLLCDINNIYVSAHNLGLDPVAYLDAFPADAIGEVHLAGHAVRALPVGATIRIDDHGSAVAPAVWCLYEHALRRFGPVPTLIERDTNIPALAVLMAEAATAQSFLDTREERRYAHADAA
jgi:uncharacterized protein (UPF0276 family)